MQPGDVPYTYTYDLVEQFHFKPATSLEEGINHFVNWYGD